MALLDALKELHAWMRLERVSYARCGDLELRIELAPLAAPSPSPSAPASPPTPEDDERSALAELLHSTNADPDQLYEYGRKLRDQKATS